MPLTAEEIVEFKKRGLNPEEFEPVGVDSTTQAFVENGLNPDEWEPVEEATTTQPKYQPPMNPFAPTGVPDLAEASKPLVTLPRWESSNHPLIAGAYNVAKSVPEFISSPVGLASLPVAGGVLGNIGKRLLAGGFGAHMATTVPEQARQAGEASVIGTPQQKAEAMLGLGLTGALIPAFGAGAMIRGKAPVEVAPKVEPVLQRPLTSSYLEQQRLAKIANEQPPAVVEKPVMDIREPEKIEARQPPAIVKPAAQEPIIQQPKPLVDAPGAALGEHLQRAENLVANDIAKRYAEDTSMNQQKFESEILKANQKKIDEEMALLEEKLAQQRVEALQKVYERVAEPVRPELMKGGKLEERVTPEQMDQLEQQRIREKDLREGQLPNDVLTQQRIEELNRPKLPQPEPLPKPQPPLEQGGDVARQYRQEELNKGGKLIQPQEEQFYAKFKEPLEEVKTEEPIVDADVFKNKRLKTTVEKFGVKQPKAKTSDGTIGKGINKALSKAGEEGSINIDMIKDVLKKIKEGRVTIGPISSDVLRMVNSTDPTHQAAGKGINKYWARFSENTGKYANRVAKEMHDTKVGKAGDEALRKYAWEMKHGRKPTVTLTPEQQARYDAGNKFMSDVADDAGKFPEPILIGGKRAIIKSKHPTPDIMDPTARDLLMNKPLDPRAKDLHEAWAKHIVIESGKTGKPFTIDAARNEVDTIIKNWSSGGGAEQGIAYNPLRTAEGFGLPYELVNKSYGSTLEQYANRVAKDFSWHEAVESDPVMRGILNTTDQWGSTSKNATKLPTGEKIGQVPAYIKDRFLAQVKGNHHKAAAEFEAFNAAVKAGMLQFQTGGMDTIYSYFMTLPNLTFAQTRHMITASKDVVAGYKEGVKQGVIRPSTSDYESILTGLDSFSTWFRKLADIGTLISGRRYGDVGAKAMQMAIGKAIIPEQLFMAGKNAKLRARLQELADLRSIEGWEKWVGKNPLTIPDDIVNKFSAAIVDRVSGTYDPRRGPGFAYDPMNPLSSFTRLSRWSLDQTNALMEHIVNPALKGDFAPLIKYALAGTVTAGASYQFIKLLRRVLPYDPSPAEAFKYGMKSMKDRGENPNATGPTDEVAKEEMLWSVIRLMDLGGVGALYTKVLNTVGAARHGRLNNMFYWPALGFMQNTAEDVVHAFTAIGAGEPAFPVIREFLKNFMIDNVQAANILSKWALSPDELKRRDMWRDVNVWKQLMGEKASFQKNYNRYMGLSTRDWRREQDPEKIIEMAPKEIEKAVTKAKDPMEVEKNIEGLGNTPALPFPSEDDPMKFMEYLNYLETTKGKEKATEMLGDYLFSKGTQEMKRDVVKGE